MSEEKPKFLIADRQYYRDNKPGKRWNN
jgi:hypothetical protein